MEELWVEDVWERYERTVEGRMGGREISYENLSWQLFKTWTEIHQNLDGSHGIIGTWCRDV